MQDFPLYGVYNSRNIKNRIENNRNENEENLENYFGDASEMDAESGSRHLYALRLVKFNA